MNASNKVLQRALKNNERRLRDFELADLESVLATFEGRRFYYRLVFEVCNLESSSLTRLSKTAPALPSTWRTWKGGATSEE